MTADIFADLEQAFARQSLFLCGREVRLKEWAGGRILNNACDRYLYCLSRKNIKHYPSNILMNSDEYTSFLVFLASEAYSSQCNELAELVYVLNRKLHSFECFYTREIPDLFHLVHPLGSVLGQAAFDNYLVVYQGVSVGGDMKLRYPSFGEGVALFANSTVLGKAVIGSNCAIGAGVQVYGDTVPDCSSLSLREGIVKITSNVSWSVKVRFFK